MINHTFMASPGRYRTLPVQGRWWFLLLMLVVCGTAQSATTALDPHAEFGTDRGDKPPAIIIEPADGPFMSKWSAFLEGKEVHVALPTAQDIPRVTSPGRDSTAPSRLSFFYLMGAAVLVALLLELFGRKDT